MTSPSTPAGSRTSAASAGTSTRPISANRGELFPLGSFGHTGFTGTSLWIDPATRRLRHLPVEPLAPRTGRATSRRCARGVATIVAAALAICRGRRRRAAFDRSPRFRTIPAPLPRRAAAAPVLTGIDVLRARGLRAAQRQAGRADHQSHRPRPRRHDDDRSPARGARRDAGRALQSRARHPRHARRERAVEKDEQDRPADSLALRRHAAAHRRDARGLDTIVIDLQDVGVALLHLRGDDGLCDGGGGEAEDRRSSCSIGRTRSTAGRSRDRARRGRASGSSRICRMPVRHGHDDGRAGAAVQRRAQDRRGPDGRADRALAPRPLVRRDRACRGSTRRRTCAT